MTKTRALCTLFFVLLIAAALARPHVRAATPVPNFVVLAIPYQPGTPATGTLAVEIVDPEDHVLAHAQQTLAARAEGGTWKQTVVLPEPLSSGEVVWDRIRYRFTPQSGARVTEGILPVSTILSRPVVRILAQPTYLAGSLAAVRVIVADAAPDAPPSTGSVTISLQQNGDTRQLFTAKLDARGTVEAAFRLPAGVTGKADLHYVAATATGTADYTQPIQLEEKAAILLTTEKPLYQPGQAIHVRALALDRADHRAVASRPILFEIEDSHGNKVFRRNTSTDAFGIASADFQLADEVNLGTYHVRAHLGENNDAELALNVERYVLPKFKVAIEFAQSKKYYRPGDHITGTVRANYFFGKPVDHADIALKLSGMDVAVFEAASTTGHTDAEGAYKFDLKLPPWASARSSSGAARALIEATVKDNAAHSEVRGEPITISAEALLLTAVPEGGTFAPGLDNQVFILAAYPDGTPAAGASLLVTSQGDPAQRVQADAGGVALILAHNATTLKLEANDHKGASATTTVDLQVRSAGDQVLLRTPKAVVRAGDKIPVEVLSTRRTGAAYVDVVKNGQTILTRDVDLVDGHAQFTLVATPDMAGTLDLDAYIFGRDAQPVMDHRLLFVQPAEELRITANADQQAYKPGADARIRFHVTNQHGEGVSAALGLQIVDEAVFALAEKQPGFARVFFYLEQEVMKPRYEIHSLSLADAISSEAPELPSRALFAATEMAAPAKVDVEFGRTLPDAQYDAYRTRYDQAFRAQVLRIAGAAALPQHPAVEALVDAIAQAARQGSARDAWGHPIHVEPAPYYNRGERYIKVTSAGPDGTFDSADDLTVYLAARTGKVRSSVNQSFGIDIDHDRGPNTPNAEITGTVTDASGALIPNGAIILHAEKSPERKALTDPNGDFALQAIPAGRYRIEISAQGFITQSGFFIVAPRDLATLHVQLSAGAVTDAVTVNADGAVFEAMPAPQPPPMPVMMRGMAAGMAMAAAPQALPMQARNFTMRAMKAAAPAGATRAGAAQAAETHVRSYFPEALYINPEIITDAHGNASIEIPVADSITTWRMAMLASTTGGALGSATGSLKVFQDFFADVDLPVTLTQGDRVTLPVALYNYTSTDVEVTSKLEPAYWYQLENDQPDKHTTVPTGRVGAASYTLSARRIGKFKLTLTAQAGSRRDVVVREIEVVPNGREQTSAANGNLDGTSTTTQSLRFPADALPDATTAFVRLYPGPLSQVIEGMDGILQMPGGCFEQTSSSTYPNVLALDYMKRSKKLTPEVHARAEGYIANGYQRLLTFEVRGGGFSWFGQTPANKILTAYGLMEFSDMSKVADVDPRVIERTRNWLISQQQADGSWKPDTYFINEGATNRFNTDVVRITAYLAWALANTGYQGPATDRAKAYLQSHRSANTDAYTLAVTASFAADYKQDRDFTNTSMQALLQARTQQGDDVFWTSEQTGMYGAGDSATIETTGLAVQALLHWGQANDAVRKALHYLTAKKSAHGNWGTTQATIMALKALLAASEKGSADVHGSVQVQLNGRTVQTLQLTADNNDLLHQFVLPNLDPHASNDVQVKFTGTGSLAYQVATRYYLPWNVHPATEALSIDVAYDRTTLAQSDVATATATVHNNLPKTANMVMVDLGIPPGFELLTEDLQAFEEKTASAHTGKLEKFSLTATQAILYFNALAPRQTIALKFRLRAKYPIHAKTFASRVYEYYDPAITSTARPIQLEVHP